MTYRFLDLYTNISFVADINILVLPIVGQHKFPVLISRQKRINSLT